MKTHFSSHESSKNFGVKIEHVVFVIIHVWLCLTYCNQSKISLINDIKYIEHSLNDKV
jgi:hypothetical protein